MADEPEATVQLIDEHAWERAEVVPIGEPLAVNEWLAKLDHLGMVLGVLPPRRIAGGPYDGGWVVSADNARGRLYFAVPASASRALGMRVPGVLGVKTSSAPGDGVMPPRVRTRR